MQHGLSIGSHVPEDFSRWWVVADFTPPTDWAMALEEMIAPQSVDRWGLQAAIHVARTRKRHGRGPSFLELFDHLNRTNGIQLAPLENLSSAQRRLVRRGFERCAASAWRAAGWIAWSRESHSLRVGPAFRAASRAHQASTKRRPAE
jgi:hypothetical protein